MSQGSNGNLEHLAADIVRRAVGRGASEAECTIVEGDEFSVGVRLGEVEKLKEAGSRGAGLRVLIGKCAGASYTSDLTPAGIGLMVDSALALARVTTEDPFAGLPEPDEFGRIDGDLRLYFDDV
ncbi:MAG: PmbA/TldA family metallopeptidase, partial [Bryobacteraceae bacterium]